MKKALFTLLFITITLIGCCNNHKHRENSTEEKVTVNKERIDKKSKETDSEILKHEPIASAKQIIKGKVTRVSDGDTFNIEWYEGKVKHKERIRSYGIDAPESNQPYGEEAKAFLSKHILHKEITVYVKDVDRYKRKVGIAFVNGKDINLETLKAGYAWHYKQYDKTTTYSKAEQTARKRAIGLWQDDSPMYPSDWRKLQKEEKTKNKKKPQASKKTAKKKKAA